MYRDEEAALRARVEALESELKTEELKRKAAEAEARAAEARALEQSIKMEPETVKAARRRRMVLITVGLGAAVVGYMFSSSFIYIGDPESLAGKTVSPRRTSELAARNEQLARDLKQHKMMLEELGLRLRRSEDRLKSELSNETVDPITGKVESKAPPADYTEVTRITLGQARQAYLNKDYKGARKLARLILKLHPGDARAMMLLGASSCQLEDASTAQDILRMMAIKDQLALQGVCRGARVLLEVNSP